MLQAFWISLGYVAIGLTIDGLRRATGSGLWEHASGVVDSLALMLLRRAGLVDRLIGAIARNAISPFGARLLLSATTIVAIFAQAVVVAALFYGFVWLVRRGKT